MSKVGPYICWDDVVNAATGDEDLDNILDILDFPIESLEGEEFAGDWDVSNSDDLGPIPSDVLIHPPMIVRTKTDAGPRTLMPTSAAPQTKIGATPKPEQLPFKFREKNRSTEVQEQGAFHTQSPVSVLESSRSTSAAKSSLTKPQISKRARSKRSRPSGLSPWLLISSPFVVSSPASRKAYNARKNKERKKQSLPSVAPQQPSEVNPENPIQTVTKKCSHCEVTKTPQWREGPTGAKSLCNACGVRYRAGRLFPEYRPAASPTFVPSIHSNWHKKVVEMRTKGNQQDVTKTEVPLNSCYLVDRICLD